MSPSFILTPNFFVRATWTTNHTREKTNNQIDKFNNSTQRQLDIYRTLTRTGEAGRKERIKTTASTLALPIGSPPLWCNFLFLWSVIVIIVGIVPAAIRFRTLFVGCWANRSVSRSENVEVRHTLGCLSLKFIPVFTCVFPKASAVK